VWRNERSERPPLSNAPIFSLGSGAAQANVSSFHYDHDDPR
jgi:hypothetical protein